VHSQAHPHPHPHPHPRSYRTHLRTASARPPHPHPASAPPAGLLSAHALTGDKLFLSRALNLGKRLLGAFKTDTQLPAPNVNLKTRRPAWGWG